MYIPPDTRTDDELVAKLSDIPNTYHDMPDMQSLLAALIEGEIINRKAARVRLGLPPGFDGVNVNDLIKRCKHG